MRNQPKRIAVFSSSEFPGVWGDTTNYLELLKGLASKGTDIVLVCPWHPQASIFDKEMSKQGIKVSRIFFRPPRVEDLSRSLLLSLTRLGVFYVIESLTSLYLFLKKRIRYCFVRYEIPTMPIPLLAWLLRINCVCDILMFPTSMPEPSSKTLGRVSYILDKKLLRFCRGFRVMNREDSFKIRQLGVSEDRILVSHPGMDLSRKPPVTSFAEIPPATFAYFGSLEKWQGLDLLIESFSEIVKEHKDAKLYIIGDGPLRNSLRNLSGRLHLSRNIIFVRSVPRQILWNYWFKKFRVVVIPRPASPSSSLVPMKLIESLAGAKVVIVTSINSFIDGILRNCSIVVPPNDKNALVSAMTRLITNEKLQKSLSKKSTLVKEFDISKTVDSLIRFFTAIEQLPQKIAVEESAKIHYSDSKTENRLNEISTLQKHPQRNIKKRPT